MNTLYELKQHLVLLTPDEVHGMAKKTGVPASTIFKVRGGFTKNPRIQTLEPLFCYFKRSSDLHRKTDALENEAA